MSLFLDVLDGRERVTNKSLSKLNDLVDGRRVALVGSAVISSPMGAIIDRHDVIARTKYFGATFAQSESTVGRKTTIAYYNKASALIADLANSSQDHFDTLKKDGLSLVVSKRPLKAVELPWLSLRIPCPTYLTRALLGTKAILHLLAAQPRELSVFGMDFYLADQPHYPGDLNERDRAARGAVRDNAHYCLAFAQHDPFSQIRFVRHLAEAGAITPYGRTAEVLAMTDLEYAKGLEARYGRWDRP
jgi:hypothetical protein